MEIEISFDDIDAIIAQGFPSRSSEPKPERKFQFRELNGFAKFRWNGETYARLNKRLALHLGTRRVEFMEDSATVEMTKEDYLHGISYSKQEEFLEIAEKPWESLYHPDGEIRRKLLAEAQISVG